MHKLLPLLVVSASLILPGLARASGELSFLPGYFFSWVLKKLNLLRVPPEVELEGLDLAEFGMDFYPEFERVPETITEPDGREVESADILLEAYRATTNGKAPTKVEA